MGSQGVLPRNQLRYRWHMEIPVRLIERLRTARHLVVLTGAGISAESGLPTFRDKQTGLWERFKPEDLATPRAFDRDPALVWGWYEWRRMKAARALPNPAHLAIKALEELVPQLTLITQNVDDLHERAGNRDVLHLHGTLTNPICASCKRAIRFASRSNCSITTQSACIISSSCSTPTKVGFRPPRRICRCTWTWRRRRRRRFRPRSHGACGR